MRWVEELGQDKVPEGAERDASDYHSHLVEGPAGNVGPGPADGAALQSGAGKAPGSRDRHSWGPGNQISGQEGPPENTQQGNLEANPGLLHSSPASCCFTRRDILQSQLSCEESLLWFEIV